MAWAAMQGVRRGMGWWRGRGGRGGASRRNDEARQWLWPRRRSSAVTDAFGGGKNRGGESVWGRERESRGSGQRRGDDARRHGVQAMQTSRVVAWRARARAPSPSSAYWREEEGDREEEVGWAAQC